MDGLKMGRRDVLMTAAGAAAIGLAGQARAAAPQPVAIGMGRGQLFDEGWRFHKGAGTGFEIPALDDAGWRTIDLPHDWSVEDLPADPGDPARIIGPFDRKVEGGTLPGFAVGGEGWYRKHFRLADARPGRAEILFDGVYMNSDIWLNGHHLGGHHNGYIPAAYDLTPYLIAGDNVLAVRVCNLGYNARWHSGAGLYRHVWLDMLPARARIARWGVNAVTRRISEGSADLALEIGLEDVTPGLLVRSRIRDKGGRVVWEKETPAASQITHSASLASARLWSPEEPNLYILETELYRGKTLVDRTETPFGIRILTFDATDGMRINGVATKLRGGCVHHDHGILGAAAFDAAEDRKVALLKARGFNAVRPSHNLFSPAFLRACDQQGLFVICEAFDMWRDQKFSPNDFSRFFEQDWQADLTTMVMSARHHPSVIMWSIGNEIPGRNTSHGVETQWKLANAVHRLDPSRPVTGAINGFVGHEATPSPSSARTGSGGATDRTSSLFLDLVGYNYKLTDYDADHVRFPDRIFYGSESFPKDVVAIWDKVGQSPWLIGDFVWTAMDYLGEAGIGGSSIVPAAAQNAMAAFAEWPWINAYCGDIDLIGQQKPASLLRDVVWGVSPLEIAVQRPVPEGKAEALRYWGWSDELQSWTWPGAEGRPIAVRVYSSCDRVELRLDGHRVDSRDLRPADGYRAEFTIPYQPGRLEVMAFRNGREVARRQIETAGPAAAVRLVEENRGGHGRQEISFVRVELVDVQGRLLPDLDHEVELTVAGAGELLAFGSANPLATGSLQSPRTRTWHGRALAVVRSSGPSRTIILNARSEGKASATLKLRMA
ncbi:MAG TPA: glycoside hydrolase family 2 TIM barrel-domain containing protein [Sphingobium sp.]|uniref:sugar-binding domain-containing protein n=1 Tax=Sphingobium sp. TaxID=1912891 RepID=UPI002ED4B0A3